MAGVYVHVPYCRRRCPYCDFYFEVRPADAQFAAAIVREYEARASEIEAPARTVSFGGGTPTALPVGQLATIVAAVPRTEDAEVSLEVNPEDLASPADAGALADAGFTRASIGVQSFDASVLAYLGRAHDPDRARAAVRALVAAGVRVGIDLIVGVPGEDAARIERDVAEARALGVGHVSTYLLTVEAGTPLVQLIARKQRAAVDDDAQADAYLQAQDTLAASGYRQYEVSSFARPGDESVHNRSYWAHVPYLGLGPGAHSMRVENDGRVHRRHTTARLDAWLADPAGAAHEDEVLEPAHALREGVAFGLRDLQAGVDVHALAALHHADAAAIERSLKAAIARGDVVITEGRARLTPTGARFADRVARDVLAS